MANVLDEILAHKRARVEQARAAEPIESLRARPGYLLPRRNFYGAVTVPRGHGPNLIAEIKHASPSAGVIRPAGGGVSRDHAAYDPSALARAYEAGGAQALSVLTDERWFGGRREHIEQVKAAVGLPVLRKDFLVDAWQIYESRAYGADAVLVIAEALPPHDAVELVRLARDLELAVILEVHTSTRLFAVLQQLPEELRQGLLLGINNRDLAAQRVDLATTEALAPLVPQGLPLVSESGIRTRRDVERMHAAGARALLIGEALLRSSDPARTIRELLAR